MTMFTISGSIDGVARTILWEDGVFDDPSDRVKTLIERGRRVGLTPTGPFYVPGALPMETAVVTSLAAFDDRTVAMSPEAQEVLEEIHNRIWLEIPADMDVVF